jgi:hypothetical protein
LLMITKLLLSSVLSARRFLSINSWYKNLTLKTTSSALLAVVKHMEVAVNMEGNLLMVVLLFMKVVKLPWLEEVTLLLLTTLSRVSGAMQMTSTRKNNLPTNSQAANILMLMVVLQLERTKTGSNKNE